MLVCNKLGILIEREIDRLALPTSQLSAQTIEVKDQAFTL